jgi:signal transduction histidine kinase
MTEPALSRIVALLSERKSALLERWIAAVRSDPAIPSVQRLDDDEVRDYVPKLIDELAESMAQSARTGPRGATGHEIGGTDAARVHARDRFATHYTLAELLRELAWLRGVLLDLAAEDTKLEGWTVDEAKLVHQAIDEVMITAAVEMEQASAQELRRDLAFRELFIGILGHDLRNPLSSIVFTTAALLRAEEIPPGQARALRRIAASADRMGKLIHDMLDLTRLRSGGGLAVERRPVDLGKVCREVIEELEVIHANRSIVWTADGDLWGAWDPDRLAQLVSNLVGNALTYSPEGTPVRVSGRADGPGVALDVNNQGPPIPPQTMETLFDPFRRGPESARGKGGLGLGLYVAQKIVEAHGGSIRAESDAARGTTFTVVLPRAP